MHEKGLADDDLHREVRAEVDGDGTPEEAGRDGRFTRPAADESEPQRRP